MPVVTPSRASIETVKALLRHREADQAARVAGHEVDRVGRGELRGDHEVALVLPVLVVDQDEHAAVARFLDQILGAGEVLREVGHLEVVHHRNSANRAT